MGLLGAPRDSRIPYRFIETDFRPFDFTEHQTKNQFFLKILQTATKSNRSDIEVTSRGDWNANEVQLTNPLIILHHCLILQLDWVVRWASGGLKWEIDSLISFRLRFSCPFEVSSMSLRVGFKFNVTFDLASKKSQREWAFDIFIFCKSKLCFCMVAWSSLKPQHPFSELKLGISPHWRAFVDTCFDLAMFP